MNREDVEEYTKQANENGWYNDGSFYVPADAVEHSHCMYSPRDNMLDWLRMVFKTSKKKYELRYKSRDPYNTVNKDSLLSDSIVGTYDTKDELIERLLKSVNRMNNGIVYLVKDDKQKELQTTYALNSASGGFSVQKYILPDGHPQKED